MRGAGRSRAAIRTGVKAVGGARAGAATAKDSAQFSRGEQEADTRPETEGKILHEDDCARAEAGQGLTGCS